MPRYPQTRAGFLTAVASRVVAGFLFCPRAQADASKKWWLYQERRPSHATVATYLTTLLLHLCPGSLVEPTGTLIETPSIPLDNRRVVDANDILLPATAERGLEQTVH